MHQSYFSVQFIIDTLLQPAMLSCLKGIILAFALCVASAPMNAQNSAAASADTLPIPHSEKLDQLVDRGVKAALQKFADKNLQSNQIAVTLIDLRDPKKIEQGSYRGREKIYPASVIKLFYLVAAHQWLEDGKLKDTDELRRAMRDMIIDSYNEATGYIVDLLTDTTSGPELPPVELDKWFEKRNAVNRYFATLGYNDINAN